MTIQPLLFYSWLTHSISVNGFGAGPAETIAPAVISDIFFLHDRGKYNTLYFVCYFGSLMVGPIVAGPMAEAVGWRNFWWLNVGLFGLNIILNFFTFPETKWHRVHPDEIKPSSQTPSENMMVNQTSTTKLEGSELQIENSNTDSTNAPFPNLAATETAMKDPYLGKGAPSKEHFKLWQPADPHYKFLEDILTPWKLLSLPIVQFASFVVSWSASCFLMINLTQSQNFAAPPYNYSSLTIGKLPHPSSAALY